MSLKPSIRQMLTFGQDNGLQTLEEAYSLYMRYYDVFFLIADYAQQFQQLQKDLEDAELVEIVNGTKFMKELTIEEALSLLGE